MDALSLISKGYETDSSDDESEVNSRLEAKRPKLSVPKAIQTLDCDDGDDVRDDPALHDFRIRSFPHVRGNWASYIYIEVIDDLVSLQKGIVNGLRPICDARIIDNPHVSVSKVFTLQYHWIDGFIDGLRNGLRTIEAFPIRISSDDIELFVNEAKTRTFVSLCCEGTRLQKLTKAVDKVLADFGQEPFYAPAMFHVSLAWCLGDEKANIEKAMKTNSHKVDIGSTEAAKLVWDVRHVHCKIGNKNFVIGLS